MGKKQPNRISLINFWWIEPGAEFEIIEQDNSEPGFPNMTILEYRGGKKPRIYYPLDDNPGLFKIFADTPVNAESIAGFASKYGPLRLLEPPDWLTNSWDDVLAKNPSADFRVWQNYRKKPGFDRLVTYYTGQTELFGGYVNWWIDEINKMRSAVALWERLRSASWNTIEHHYVLDSNKIHQRLDDGSLGLGIDLNRFKSFAPDDNQHTLLRFGAWALLQSTISSYIEDCFAGLRFSTNLTTEQRISIYPKDLRTALWVQFAEAVQGNQHFESCANCGDWFLQRTARKKMYCSNACKNRAYRANKMRNSK